MPARLADATSVAPGIEDESPPALAPTDDRNQFAAAAERARQRGFKYRELLDAGHDAMITQPAELVRLLLD